MQVQNTGRAGSDIRLQAYHGGNGRRLIRRTSSMARSETERERIRLLEERDPHAQEEMTETADDPWIPGGSKKKPRERARSSGLNRNRRLKTSPRSSGHSKRRSRSQRGRRSHSDRRAPQQHRRASQATRRDSVEIKILTQQIACTSSIPQGLQDEGEVVSE